VSIDYHLEELKIARDPTHPRHLLPPLLPPSRKVLDIGCGAGQTLMTAYPDRFTYGLDVDFEALKLGRSLTDRVFFACARAEALPYPDGHFDAVIARGCLPYTNIHASLKEIHRVLRPGGTLWMTLCLFSVPWKQAQRANWKGRIYFLYIVLNSLHFHFFQNQFSFFGRRESFQTARGITRALRRHGFDRVTIQRGAHFVVTARTPGAV